MRAKVAKNLNDLIPNSALPTYITRNEKIDLRRFKKMVWNKLNWRERSAARKRLTLQP